jgi:cyclopropane fatty-acyl-phospholipid synthase-like methyltransferase
MGRERLEIEFGRHAGWIVEAIEALDLDAIPAACRGTGDPKLFEQLADAIGAKRDSFVLDVGCGIGGPGAWLTRERGSAVIGIDVMETSVRGSRRLFPQVGSVVATTRSLPFRASTFDAALAMGVIETITHKSEALTELARVLTPNARLAAYTFVSATGNIDDAPMADRFEPLQDVVDEFERGGFRIVSADPSRLARPPADWRRSQEAAREHARQLHRDDPAYEAVEREQDKFARLAKSGAIQAWVIVGAKEAA